jgi:hypothetical protein
LEKMLLSQPPFYPPAAQHPRSGRWPWLIPAVTFGWFIVRNNSVSIGERNNGAENGGKHSNVTRTKEGGNQERPSSLSVARPTHSPLAHGHDVLHLLSSPGHRRRPVLPRHEKLPCLDATFPHGRERTHPLAHGGSWEEVAALGPASVAHGAEETRVEARHDAEKETAETMVPATSSRSTSASTSTSSSKLTSASTPSHHFASPLPGPRARGGGRRRRGSTPWHARPWVALLVHHRRHKRGLLLCRFLVGLRAGADGGRLRVGGRADGRRRCAPLGLGDGGGRKRKGKKKKNGGTHVWRTSGNGG